MPRTPLLHTMDSAIHSVRDPDTLRCYACDGNAVGFRDRRAEGGAIERACGRHSEGWSRQLLADLQDAYHYAGTALGEEETFLDARSGGLLGRIALLDSAAGKLRECLDCAYGHFAVSDVDPILTRFEDLSEGYAINSEAELVEETRKVFALVKELASLVGVDARTETLIAPKAPHDEATCAVCSPDPLVREAVIDALASSGSVPVGGPVTAICAYCRKPARRNSPLYGIRPLNFPVRFLAHRGCNLRATEEPNVDTLPPEAIADDYRTKGGK